MQPVTKKQKRNASAPLPADEHESCIGTHEEEAMMELEEATVDATTHGLSSSSSSSLSLSELPAECTCEVLGWLDVVDLLRATAVCRSWRSLATSSHATTTSAFPGRRSLYYGTDGAIASDDAGGAVVGGGRLPLWERAYFRSWPLPQLPPLPAGQPQSAKFELNEPPAAAAPAPASDAALNWMAVAKERLRLQYSADRTKAPAIIKAQVRACLARGLKEEEGWERLEALTKALKAAVRTVRRQDKLVRHVQAMLAAPYVRCDEQTKALFISGLLPRAYLLNTRCKGTRSEHGRITYISNVVMYSLTTGLPLYFTLRHTSDTSNDPEATCDLSLHGLPQPPPPPPAHEEQEYGGDEDEDEDEEGGEMGFMSIEDKLATFTRVMAFLFGAERIRWLPSETQTVGMVFCSLLSHVQLYGLFTGVADLNSMTADLPL